MMRQLIDRMQVAWWAMGDCGAAMRRIVDPTRLGPAEPLPLRAALTVRGLFRRRAELRARAAGRRPAAPYTATRARWFAKTQGAAWVAPEHPGA